MRQVQKWGQTQVAKGEVAEATPTAAAAAEEAATAIATAAGKETLAYLII
jgi:hypothetical protein